MHSISVCAIPIVDQYIRVASVFNLCLKMTNWIAASYGCFNAGDRHTVVLSRTKLSRSIINIATKTQRPQNSHISIILARKTHSTLRGGRQVNARALLYTLSTTRHITLTLHKLLHNCTGLRLGVASALDLRSVLGVMVPRLLRCGAAASESGRHYGRRTVGWSVLARKPIPSRRSRAQPRLRSPAAAPPYYRCTPARLVRVS